MPVLHFTEVKKQVEQVYPATRDQVKEVSIAARRELARLTAQAAPYRTGALREAIEPTERRTLIGFIGIKAGEIRGQRPDVYWGMVEFGTVNMDARPFIVPTAERYADVFLARIQKAGPNIERVLQSRGQRFL